jgi:predicted O-methyltransferase YrrM
LTVLPRLADDAYDLVFVDAARTEYPAYLAHALRLLRPGGLLLINGILGGGKVPDPTATDSETAALRTCAATIGDDPDLRAEILPVGDGLLVAAVAHPG